AVDGRSDLAEQELTHPEGYAASRPVRVGNAAHGQLQMDIYGELMDAAYLHNKYAAPVGYDSWRHLRALVDWVAGNWGREDEGVWEVRGGRRHYGLPQDQVLEPEGDVGRRWYVSSWTRRQGQEEREPHPYQEEREPSPYPRRLLRGKCHNHCLRCTLRRLRIVF